MFFHSKLFKFLLILFAYLLFAFQWVYNYMAVWYTNVPEETQYFKKPNMGNYTMYAYLLIISFVLFLIFGIIYLIKNPVPKFVTYILIADYFFHLIMCGITPLHLKVYRVQELLYFAI